MGTIQHHAIIVTGFNDTNMAKARRKALKIFYPEDVSEIVGNGMNGYASFFVGPDGSKEGWDDSNTGDERRQKFIAAASKLGGLKVVEVSYGECGQTIEVFRDFEEMEEE